MTAQLDITRIAQEAFIVPWRDRMAFGRALGVPIISTVVFTLLLYWLFLDYEYRELPTFMKWFPNVAYVFLLSWFAVTCHRLALLDPKSRAPRLISPMSWSVSRFFLWLVVLFLICGGVWFALIEVIYTLLINFAPGNSDDVLFIWVAYLTQLPVYYLCARLSLILPSIALGRMEGLTWAWRASKNNGWRLVFVVCLMPWLFIVVLRGLSREGGDRVVFVVLGVLSVALVIFSITALYH
jgi:hypothetical protein